MHMDVCADKDVHMDAHGGAFGHDEHGFALLQDVAHNINVDYADTILDVVACTTHRRSVKRAQMRLVSELTQSRLCPVTGSNNHCGRGQVRLVRSGHLWELAAQCQHLQ